MKKLYYLLLLLPSLVFAQSDNQNYVKSTTFRADHQESPVVTITYYDGLGRPIQQNAQKQAANGDDIITHLEYDAFGQQIKDYLPITSSTSPDYQELVEADIINYYATPTSIYQEATNVPFSEKKIENSPLRRIEKQAAPGETWQMGGGHEVKFEYDTNDKDEVLSFSVNVLLNTACNCYEPSLTNNGYFDRDVLYKTIIKDENWTSGKNNTTEEFKDIYGKVLLKRAYADVLVNNIVQSTNEIHDTYYIYDNFGNLTYVIPPLADPNSINWELCYQYKYDNRNRLVEKKLPGKQWEFIVYNNQDMPVATGPAFNPFGNGEVGWLVSKYDCFGRVIYTGWAKVSDAFSSSSRITFQNNLNATWYENYQESPTAIDGVSVNYTNNLYPQGMKLLTVNYYDRYNHSFEPTIPAEIEGEDVLTNVRSLPTCSWVRVLDNESQTNAEIIHSFYDKWGKNIGVEKFNHLSGYTKTHSKMELSGKVLHTKTYHKRAQNVNEIVVTDFFEYTPEDRLLAHSQSINGGTEELIAKNDYDDLGQLITKRVGGQDVQNYYSYYQKVDYRYNIRGWLKNINDIDELIEEGENEDLFAFKINYDEVESETGYDGTELYNGNISETYWKSSSDDIKRKYGYSYDALNRLQTAVYQKKGYGVTNMYNESMSYDKNGNILALRRNGDLDADYASAGVFEIDNLVYTYDAQIPNQLKEVTDNVPVSIGFKDDAIPDNTVDYTYDENGNMTADENKGIVKIRYNHLNLPTEIEFSNGSRISYLYNAAGQKVRKDVNNSSYSIRTDYLDGFQYVNNALNFFPHSEGYVNVEGVNSAEYKFFYVYNYTDHLGNIRVSYGYDPKSTTLKTLEENHYYPFGLKHTNYNTYKRKFTKDDVPPVDTPPGTIQLADFKIKQIPGGEMLAYKYKYNGKEWQDELGLNVTAMDFRMYDNALGRFHNIDVMAEIMPSLSPYRFAFNNPVIWKDPTGLSEEEPTPNIPLKEVVVSAKARTTNDETRPSYFSYHLLNDKDVRKYKGTLEQYNAEYATNFKNMDDWYFRALYLPFKNEMIRDMHSAQQKAGQFIMGIVGSVFAAPILAASPAAASITSVLSNPLVQQGAFNMSMNAGSQYLANGGVAGDINMIEVATSGIPGTNLIPVVAGETFSLTANKFDQGVTLPNSFSQWGIQVGGGILSNRFGKATDNHMTGQGSGGAFVGEYFKLIIETGSNAAPSLVD